MTQEERWLVKYNEVVDFIRANKRNPSKHDDEERGRYLNWMKHNRKLYSAGLLKEERVEKFKELIELSEKYKRVNQYVSFKNQGDIRGTGTFIHSLYTNKHNLFPQESLSKCSLN